MGKTAELIVGIINRMRSVSLKKRNVGHVNTFFILAGGKSWRTFLMHLVGKFYILQAQKIFPSDVKLIN